MTWSTDVLSSISSDTQPSIVATFDNAKYIFNASENLGRTLLQNGRNWRRARAMFFSQTSVERTSGLTGLLMTFADTSIANLELVGPRGLTHLIASMRLYTFRDSMDVKLSEIPWSQSSSELQPKPVYSDDNITMYSFPILPPSFGTDSGPVLDATPEVATKRKRSVSPDIPSKRSASTSPPSAPVPPVDTLREAMLTPGFQPQFLDSSLANEYRDTILRSMFKTTRTEGKTPQAKKKGKKPAAEASGKSDTPLPVDLPHEPDPTANADNQKRTRSAIPQGFHLQLPTFSSELPPWDTPPTMAYLVLGPRYRGKFDAKKAKALGVVGRNCQALVEGKSVTVQVKEGDGVVERVVQPHEVIGEGENPSAFIVLDVPTPGHIASAILPFKHSAFYSQIWSEDGLRPPSKDFTLRTIYHLCGDDVLDDPTYKAFMKGFGPDVHHVIASKQHCPDPLTFTSAGFQQLRMNKIDPELFPIPKYSLTPRRPLTDLPRNVYPMTASLHVSMRPFKPPTSLSTIQDLDLFHPIATGQSPLEISAKFEERIAEARAAVSQLEASGAGNTPGKDVGIISLGTGGSLPSKYRNVLSTLVTIPNYGNVLFDTGEATWGQLARNFGLDIENPNNAWQVLRDLKCISISHIHADHHLGLAQILAKRRTLDPPPEHPLYVVAVRGIHLYLRELSDIQNLGLNDPSGNGVVPILSEALHYRSKDGYKTSGVWQVGGSEPWVDFATNVENGRKMCQSLGLNSFQTIDMYHRCRCYGSVMRHKDGWSVAFSGDTMPTDNIVYGARNATVLIHEATMGDDQADLALKKSHSTIGQAIGVGRKMNAKNILLTHFSARYPKMPPLTIEPTNGDDTPSREASPDRGHEVHIAPAFDLSNMTIGNMWKLKHYIPALQANYEETKSAEDEEIEQVAASESVISNVSRD